MPFFNFGKSAVKSTLGVDIGTTAVKVVQLGKEAGRFKLENYALFKLDSAGLSGGELGDQAIAASLKQILMLGKFAGRDAVASIGSLNTFSTIITMPYLSEQDIAKTIPFEARKYIPVPLDQVVLDWSIINVVAPGDKPQILGNGGAGGAQRTGNFGAGTTPTVEVYIVAVAKNETERYKRIITQTGVNLRALELENSALIRALVGNDLSPVAIINIGGRSSAILIVDNGFERVSHNYEIGGAAITQAIAKALAINLARAEELQRNPGAQKENADLLTKAMASLVDLIAFETNKIIHNYEDLKRHKIGKTVLVGGLANLEPFVRYFSGKLGRPVELGNPLARIVYPPALERVKTELNSTFPIALGLAQREL